MDSSDRFLTNRSREPRPPSPGPISSSSAIDGKPVTHADDIARIVTATLSPGQTVRFRVQRGGNEILLPVTLSERPAAPTRC